MALKQWLAWVVKRHVDSWLNFPAFCLSRSCRFWRTFRRCSDWADCHSVNEFYLIASLLTEPGQRPSTYLHRSTLGVQALPTHWIQSWIILAVICPWLRQCWSTAVMPRRSSRREYSSTMGNAKLWLRPSCVSLRSSKVRQEPESLIWVFNSWESY